MFEIIKFIAIGKGFIAPALNGITEPLFDGGEEGIEGFNVIAFGLTDHATFAVDGDDAVIPKAVVENLFDDDDIAVKHVGDNTVHFG